MQKNSCMCYVVTTHIYIKIFTLFIHINNQSTTGKK